MQVVTTLVLAWSNAIIAWNYLCTNPQTQLKRDHIVPAMKRTSSSSQHSEIPTSKRRIWNNIMFWSYLYLLLYTPIHWLAVCSGSPAADVCYLWPCAGPNTVGFQIVNISVSKEAISICISVYLVASSISRVTTYVSQLFTQLEIFIINHELIYRIKVLRKMYWCSLRLSKRSVSRTKWYQMTIVESIWRDGKRLLNRESMIWSSCWPYRPCETK